MCHSPGQPVQCCILLLGGFRFDEVDVNVVVFTNILKDKVDEFGGIEAYLAAQGALLDKLQSPDTQLLVVNMDGKCLHAQPQASSVRTVHCWSAQPQTGIAPGAVSHVLFHQVKTA